MLLEICKMSKFSQAIDALNAELALIKAELAKAESTNKKLAGELDLALEMYDEKRRIANELQGEVIDLTQKLAAEKAKSASVQLDILAAVGAASAGAVGAVGAASAGAVGAASAGAAGDTNVSSVAKRKRSEIPETP